MNQDLDSVFVSGWEDDETNEGIDIDLNPDDEDSREVLNASENGNKDKLMILINANPNLVNATDKEGYTPLHRACYGNHVDTVKYLLQNGAQIDAKTELKWEPLHSCCRWNHIECATILIAEGANVNAPTEGGQTPLHIAASYGACYDMVQMLLSNPFIDTKLKNNSGETAIDIARRSSKYYKVFDMSDSLLNDGVNL